MSVYRVSIEEMGRRRRQIFAAMLEKEQYNCPVCGKMMHFSHTETYQEFETRHNLKFNHKPKSKRHHHTATLDHLIPKCREGSDHWRNLFVMCGQCNSDKGNMTAVEWINWRKDTNSPLSERASNRLKKYHWKAARNHARSKA